MISGSDGRRGSVKNNIILIGMPGVGKSTAGVILAKILGYSFVDTDLLIQQSEKRLLKDIIASEGIDGFISIENKVNSMITAENSVIATGGSVIYGEQAMKHLCEIGTVVYLSLGYSQLRRRLRNIRRRGVVIREGQSFSDLYNERVPLYEKYADIIVDETGCSIERTIDRVIKALGM